MQIPIIPFRGQKRPWNSVPRINRRHPIAAGLGIYICDVGGVLFDLVFGEKGSLNTATAVTRSPSIMGTGYRYVSGGGSFNFPVSPRVNAVVPPVSIVCSFFMTAAPVNAVMFGVGDPSGNTPIYVQADSATTMRQGFNNGLGDLTYTVPTVTGAYHTMAGVGASTTSLAAYYDGRLQTTSGGNPTSTFATAQPLFNAASNAGTTGNTTVGFIYYGGIWTRALSPAEILLLHQDPYCFLLFPEDEIFANMVGVTAVTTSEDQFHQPWSSVGRRYAIIAAG